MGVTRPLIFQRLNPKDFSKKSKNWFPRLCHAIYADGPQAMAELGDLLEGAESITIWHE
jgi:hypothetical protein